MLRRLGEFSVRRRRWVLVSALIFFLAAGAFGGRVAKSLSTGGFDDPNSESSRASALLQSEFRGGNPNVVLLLRAKRGATVSDPAIQAAGTRLTNRLGAEPGVRTVISYWSLGGAPPLASTDATEALVLARILGDDDTVRERVEDISPKFTTDNPAYSVGVGGRAEVFRQVGTTVESDLRKAEGISVPVTFLLLILVFGGVVASGLPLSIGAFAIFGTFAALQVMSSLTQVSIFSLNLTTAMALGLGIDYALFIVSRYREEVRAGMEPNAAIVRSVETAGRTVLFSALTVAVSLAALLVFPLAFLRSFAYAGIGVVFMAAVAATVVLPAMLFALGDRIDRFALFRRRGGAHNRSNAELGHGFWHRVATAVMRRPILIAGSVVALLLFLGAPFLGIRFGLPDDRVLPTSASSRAVQDQIRTNFQSNEASALTVVATDIDQPAGHTSEIDAYALELSKLDGVSRVDAITGIYVKGQRAPLPPQATAPLPARLGAEHATMIDVIPSVEAVSPAGERLVNQVRNHAAPFPVRVGGPSAQLVDSKASLFG